jgi:cyanophycin synthetase
LVAAHRQRGGRAVFAHDGHLIAASGHSEISIAAIERLPLTYGGRVGFQVENVMAAAAAGWALGLPFEVLRVGLGSFAGNSEKVPGRFNLFEVGEAGVILDYGHNASALRALIEAVSTFPHRRRTVVYSAAGDRRDSDMIDQGTMLAEAFDQVILYEDHYKRGRADGEIMALFHQGLRIGGRCANVVEMNGALKAVELALANIRPGDLLVVQADCIDETVQFVRNYLARTGLGREVGIAEVLATADQPVSIA